MSNRFWYTVRNNLNVGVCVCIGNVWATLNTIWNIAIAQRCNAASVTKWQNQRTRIAKSVAEFRYD